MDNIIPGIVETFGLGIFIFYLIKGLKTKIRALEETIIVQKQTLETMERRIVETEKIGDIYRNLISNLPTDIDNYKTILSKTKDETIVELQTQNENTKKKLHEAEDQIQRSGSTKEIIASHLKVLKNLLTPSKDKNNITRKEYYLTKIAEFDGRALESSISLMVQSKTLEEYLERSGFKIHLTEDIEVMKQVFNPKREFQGVHLRDAFGTQSMAGGFHVVANEHFYVNNIRVSELKDEFSSIKTYA